MEYSIGPLDHQNVIEQLVSQQFFLLPNYIVDRTHRVKEPVLGANIVFVTFIQYLYQISKNLSGTRAKDYIKILYIASKKLNLVKKDLEKRFEEKAGAFLKEGLATESILFITTISTILETLDIVHYEKLLKTLESDVREYLRTSNSTIIDNSEFIDIFNSGIERLGEIADSNFSILLNFVKLFELARIFNLSESIKVDISKINEYKLKVINKIISGNY